MKARLLMALVVVLSLCGCGAEDLYTSDYACRFVFNTKYHAGTSIETALNGPGMYTMISASKIGGVWHIYSTLNDGQDKTEDIRLNTAEENYADYSDLGAANGIIIGQCRYFDVTTGRPVLVAWDRQCSNCLRDMADCAILCGGRATGSLWNASTAEGYTRWRRVLSRKATQVSPSFVTG